MRGMVVAVALVVVSCTADPVRETTQDPATTSEAGDPTDATVSPTPGPTEVPSAPCAVTLPNGDNPPGQTSRFSHGNGRLWVELYPHGVIRARKDDVRADGSLAIKFPWTRGDRGQLTITGRRLDADAPPARAWIPSGYGPTGFQSSAVIFPTAGCWIVTGRVGVVELRVVTKVLRPAAR
jgi:hypothetical protein